MSDPRAENCRAVKLDGSGKVIGVELRYAERPNTKYQLVQARLIDEASAGGATVATFAVVSKSGAPVSESVYLAWPWPSLDNRLLPGNQNSQHMVVNGYNPPDVGPLAVYVGDAAGNPISDVIGGLGLPWKRHVSYYLAFQERGGDGGGGGGGGESSDVAALHADLRKLAQHLGLAL